MFGKQGIFSKRSVGIFTFCLVVMFALGFSGACEAETQHAQGYVFHDANLNGIRDAGEKGVSDVLVSNGFAIVRTDAEGKYRLPVDDDTIIFITKPRGWMTPVDKDNLPKFYYVHKPKGSPQQRFKGVDPTGPLPESVDFPLCPRKEPDKFKVVMFGDTQPHNMREVSYVGHDMVQELIGVDAAFGVTLGDLVGDNLSLYEALVSAKGLVGIPWYNVKGNHDTNYDGRPDHHLTAETWARVFGPPYYAFEYGPVHFISLNNPYFGQSGNYIGKLDTRQMAWLRRYLAVVPKDQLVVLLMHIPLHWMTDKADVLRLIEDRPHTFSLSAHTHTQYHNFLGSDHGWNGSEPHHHLVHQAACGFWWTGMPDEVGIPHATSADGTPNGYSIITFDGNKYSVRFKVPRRPDDYQMNIWAPNEVKRAEASEAEVLVNVFAGSPRSVVEMKLGDSDWVQMKQVTMHDPYYVQRKEFEGRITRPVPWGGMHPVVNSYHIWKANLPKNPRVGAHLIHVRTTDMFDQTDTARRVIHIR